MEAIVVAIMLVQFSGPTGQRIDVNPAEVTSVREPKGTLLAEGVHCVIGMSNRNFISLGDDCDTVRRKLEGRGQGPCALVCGGERP
jgi:hypothetical protein